MLSQIRDAYYVEGTHAQDPTFHVEYVLHIATLNLHNANTVPVQNSGYPLTNAKQWLPADEN